MIEREFIKTENGFARICLAKDIKKTGRHFPQIEELLKAMKNNEKN